MNDANISDLCFRWAEAYDRGEDIPLTELCAAAPELLPEVRRQVEILQAMRRLAQSESRFSAVYPSLAPEETAEDSGGEIGHPASQLTQELVTPGVHAQKTDTLDYLPHPPREANLCPLIPGYELLGELGKGGMGVVYKARQTALKRVVALKMILGNAGREERQRFLLEAEAVARLHHPNIVQVYDVGEWQSGGLGLPQPYVALEFIDGGSLDGVIRRAPQSPQDSAELVRTLALALHAAHEKKIVHRDLKPQNILMARKHAGSEASGTGSLTDFTPKVADFGLAKQLDAPSSNTHTGAVMGTPSYMAPEQAEGRISDIGPWTDSYALGAILYELLTGRPPFLGQSVFDTMEQVRRAQPVSPQSLQPSCPRDLETICLKAIRKEEQARYTTALALADDLGRFLNGQPILARPVPLWERGWKWAKREPARAAALAALLLAVMVGAVGAVFYSLYREQQAVALARKLEEQQALRGRLDELRLLAEAAERAGQLDAARQHWTEAMVLLARDPEAVPEGVRPVYEQGQARTRAKLEEQSAEKERQARQQRQRLERQAAIDDWNGRLERFGQRRDEVLFHSISFRDQDAADDAALVRRAAPAALAALGLNAEQSPAEFGRGLERYRAVAETPAAVARVAGEVYQVLLAWAGAEAGRRGEDNDRQPRPRFALKLLDAAQALADRHQLATPRVEYLRRARFLEMLDDKSQAKAVRDRAAGVEAGTVLDWFESALEHYRDGRIDQAEADCVRVFQHEPSHFWTQYVGALCNLRRRQWGVAVVRLNSCLEKRPRSSWLLMHRALAHAGLGDLPAAEADFGRALEGTAAQEFRAVVLTNRSFVWMQQRRWADAERDLREAIELRPAAYQGYVNLAAVHQKQGKGAAALQAMGEAISRQPDQASLYSARAKLRLDANDLAGARQDFEEYQKRARREIGSEAWADAVVELAGLKLKAGEGKQALTDCDTVLRLLPKFAAAHRQRAETLLRLGRYAEAGQAIDRYLEAGGKGTPAVHQASGLIHAHFGRHVEAVAAYGRVLEAKRTAETHSLRGWAYVAQEALRPALADFEAALRLEKRHLEALRGRTTVLLLLGRAAEVEKVLADVRRQPEQRAELLVEVACGFSLASGRQKTLDEVTRQQRKAVELLREALQALPTEQERRKLWKEKLEKHPALGPLRRTPALLDLAWQLENQGS